MGPCFTPALYHNQDGRDKDSPFHAIPIRSTPQPQYPIKLDVKAAIKDILTQLEYQGVIEPCVSQMNKPLFPVLKPNHFYRIVLDLYTHICGSKYSRYSTY